MINITEEELNQIIKEEIINTLNEKDDRCTRIATRKYDVWPSAYASGAVVKCRQGKIWKGVSENDDVSMNEEYEDILKKEVKDIVSEMLTEKKNLKVGQILKDQSEQKAAQTQKASQ